MKLCSHVRVLEKEPRSPAGPPGCPGRTTRRWGVRPFRVSSCRFSFADKGFRCGDSITYLGFGTASSAESRNFGDLLSVDQEGGGPCESLVQDERGGDPFWIPC